MLEDNCCSNVSMPQSTASDSSNNKQQRKKSKWDQPGVVPLGNVGAFIGTAHPGVAAVSSGALGNPVSAGYGHLPLIQQHVSALVQKIQPKIQEELIAREIVINDAESSVRYRLTKRQTQDEIQNCTGAIVKTRGKYRAPNAPADGEKPLYLHVSAGTHLETTVERIKAVDQAAAMVEEILKQGPVANGSKVVQPLSTCVFLGFQPDPSLNITARIRGPNDQYVNHIMNETGSTVLLRGRGSGNSSSLNSEEQQPLHLYLSSGNPKSLEHAKLLAENLLDTICAECGASRVSSVKVYGAVAPPQQLLAGVQSSTPVSVSTDKIIANSASLTATNGRYLPNLAVYPQSSLSHGTSYNGYGGIYPQATPLQQVALALKQSTSPITSTVSATHKTENTTTSTVPEKEKRLPNKRKFQELPVAAEGALVTHQESVILKPYEVKLSMPAPVKLVQSLSNGMMPPPPKINPPPPPNTMPPPPPRFNSSTSVKKVLEVNSSVKSETKSVPETLISLMEYGEEDDDDDIEETTEEPVTIISKSLPASKPFWAL